MNHALLISHRVRVRDYINFILIFFGMNASAAEYGIMPSINTQITRNDNIFMEPGPHEPVSLLTISPKISAFVRELDWDATFDARLKNNTYSRPGLDSNDQFFNVSGNYRRERNIYSITTGYELHTNLDPESTDFGITARQADKRAISLSPAYTWLITEKTSFTTRLARSDVEYTDLKSTGLVPYILDSATFSLTHGLSEISQLILTASASDYLSDDEAIKYRLYVIQLGWDYRFSERAKVGIQYGKSNNTTTNLNTESVDFFGTPILLTQEIDYVNNGFVADVGLAYELETGQLTIGASRNNVANSTGGLSEVDSLSLRLNDRITELWGYNVSAVLTKSSAISANIQASDRTIVAFRSEILYSFANQWKVTAAYRYVERYFDNDINNSLSAYSNIVTLGITYNFPTTSTF